MKYKTLINTFINKQIYIDVMSDKSSDPYEDLLKRCDDLMNRALNKDQFIKNIAQRLEETLNLLEIASKDGNELNVIAYSIDAITYRNMLKSQL